MAGRAEELQRRKLVEGAQGINLGVPIISKIGRGMALSVATIDLTDSPFLGAVISIAGVIATNEAESSAVKEIK